MGHIKVGVKVRVRVRLGLGLYRFMVVESVLLFSSGGMHSRPVIPLTISAIVLSAIIHISCKCYNFISCLNHLDSLLHSFCRGG